MAVQACASALQASLAHQPGHASPAYAAAVEAQLPDHPWTAIEPAAVRVNLANARSQCLIVLGSLARLPLAPRIEARARDAVQIAHHLDREGLPVCLDEGEDFIFRSEANRIAFFSRSCSI